jgi:hypothetical protein
MSIKKFNLLIKGTSLTVLCLLFIFSYVHKGFSQSWDSKVKWSEPKIIPIPERLKPWFPDLTVDPYENVHVIYCTKEAQASLFASEHEGLKKTYGRWESLYYSMWNGKEWSKPRKLVPFTGWIYRNAIIADDNDLVHIIYQGPGPQGGSVQYRQFKTNDGQPSIDFFGPIKISSIPDPFHVNIAVFKDSVYVIYGGSKLKYPERSFVPDLYFRYSNDRGLHWSVPVALHPSSTAATHEQIKIDKNGIIHVTWTEGLYRSALVRGSFPKYGVYMHSFDGGNTWSSPLKITYPNETNGYLTLGVDGRGGVMLIWRTASRESPGIYYIWSRNYGKTWSIPTTIPAISSIPYSLYSTYDMATDSRGHIHLVVEGYILTKQNQITAGLFHLEWDGNSWSNPTFISNAAECWPQIAISKKDKFYVVWDSRPPFQIRYVCGELQDFQNKFKTQK